MSDNVWLVAEKAQSMDQKMVYLKEKLVKDQVKDMKVDYLDDEMGRWMDNCLDWPLGSY
jgi:hypothetical protein